MKDVRAWVEEKLEERGFSSTRYDPLQVEITRNLYPNARVLCFGLEDNQSFDAEDLDKAIEQVPHTRFVVVVPTRITHATYERAEESGICVTGFGELVNALQNDVDIAHHIDSQEQYERRRLLYNKAVDSLKRKGYHAYAIQRTEHRPLTIVTTNDYEFTVDRLYSILESYEGIDLDLVVVTNPSCRGFSTESQQAAAQVGIPLVRLDDLLNDLGTKWT